jgi:hypothetical protein
MPRISLFLGLVLALAGCGGTSSPRPENHSASPKTTPSATPDKLDPSKFDTGTYSVEPTKIPQRPTAAEAPVLEATRIGQYVVDPHALDAQLEAMVLPVNGKTVNGTFVGDAGANILWKGANIHGAVAGFAAARSVSAPEKINHLNMVVMRFRTPADAVRAREQLLPWMQKAANSTPPVRLTGTNATAFARAGYVDTSVRAVDVLGAYLSYLYLGKEGASVSREVQLAAKAMTAQRALLRQAIQDESPLDRIDDVPVDPDGLLSLTVHQPEASGVSEGRTALGPGAALQWLLRSGELAQAFANAGVDAASMDAGTLYRTRDGHSATALRDALVAANPAKIFRRVAGPRGIPTSSCLKLVDTGYEGAPYTCVGSQDRFTFETAGASLLEAQQKAAAQYVLLANHATASG